MKSKFLYFVLLSIPGCLAYISVRPLGNVMRCPYSMEKFLEYVTLDGLENYLKENKMATAACFKQIEEDYEEALDVFVTNMTEETCKMEKMYENVRGLKRNYPFFVSKAVTLMGIEIQRYVELMKKASGKGRFENIKHYNKALKDIVERGYDLYQKNLRYLERKAPSKQVETDVKNMIHVKCCFGMRLLEVVEKLFKECMKDRLSHTEGHYQS